MNPDIERIKELFDSEDYYFSMSYRDSSYRERVVSPLSEENHGGKKFMELVRKAQRYGATEIIVKAYKKASKKFKVHPEFEEHITLQDRSNQSLAGIELFGGLNGYIEQKVGLETLKVENTNLRTLLDQIRSEAENLKNENIKLKETNENLKDKVKELQWDIKQLKREHELALEEIERKTKNFDRIITLGGTALIKAAGVDEKKILGLLGIEESEPQLELEGGEDTNNNNDVKIELQQVDDEKAPALQVLNEIDTLIKQNIEYNNPQDAFRYIKSLQAVIDFLHQSEENFNKVIHLINETIMSISEQETEKTIDQ